MRNTYQLLLITYTLFFCALSQAQIITTVAGGGNLGDGGLAVAASLSTQNIAIDSDKNIYIADFNNNCIRKVNAITGNISTVAGNGIQGFSGDGGPATIANLRAPTGVTIDRFGNIYISDYGNNRIRKVDGVTSYISTIVGNGTQGYGGDGGAAIFASINMPTGITIDSSRNIYFADYGNNKIRKVNANTGIITTIAGNGAIGYGGDGGIATSATLNFPNGLALDLSGNIYIADTNNNQVLKLYNYSLSNVPINVYNRKDKVDYDELKKKIDVTKSNNDFIQNNLNPFISNSNVLEKYDSLSMIDLLLK
jgi:sugar lactone lactonase YvrE